MLFLTKRTLIATKHFITQWVTAATNQQKGRGSEKMVIKSYRSTVKPAAFIIKSRLFWPWSCLEVDPPYLSIRESLMLVAMVLGWASLSLKMLSMTESSVLVVSSPQKAHQSLTTIPAAITSLPRFTVPACQGHSSSEQELAQHSSSHTPGTPQLLTHSWHRALLEGSAHTAEKMSSATSKVLEVSDKMMNSLYSGEKLVWLSVKDNPISRKNNSSHTSNWAGTGVSYLIFLNIGFSQATDSLTFCIRTTCTIPAEQHFRRQL